MFKDLNHSTQQIWIGHQQRMDDARKTKKIYQTDLHKKKDLKGEEETESYVKNDRRNTGIAKWRQVAQDRDGWRRATREGLILLG